MIVDYQLPAGVPASAMAALMLAVFTVSVGFGVVVPLLPHLIERLLGAGVEAAQVFRHTGLLTAVYSLSRFLFAPMWGRLADRRGPRGVLLLLGLLGFGVTMLVFSFVESLAAVYAERFLSEVKAETRGEQLRTALQRTILREWDRTATAVRSPRKDARILWQR